VLLPKFDRRAPGSDEFALSHYKAQGAGARLNTSSTRTLRISIKDQLEHDTNPGKWFLFIDTYGRDGTGEYVGGEVVNSDHAAFNPDARHNASILADIRDGRTVTDALFNGVGKLLRFDLYPEFRHVLLAEFFKEIGDSDRAAAYWEKAGEIHQAELARDSRRALIWVFDKLSFDEPAGEPAEAQLSAKVNQGNFAFIRNVVYYNNLVEGSAGTVRRALAILDKDRNNTIWKLHLELSENLEIINCLMSRYPERSRILMERLGDQVFNLLISDVYYNSINWRGIFSEMIIGLGVELDLEADRHHMPSRREREPYLEEQLNNIFDFFREFCDCKYCDTLPYYVGEQNAAVFYERFMQWVDNFFGPFVGKSITAEDFNKYKQDLRRYFGPKSIEHSYPDQREAMLGLFDLPGERYNIYRYMQAFVVPEFLADLLRYGGNDVRVGVMGFVLNDHWQSPVWLGEGGFYYYFMTSKEPLVPAVETRGHSGNIRYRAVNPEYPYILANALLDVARDSAVTAAIKVDALHTAIELGAVIRWSTPGSKCGIMLWSRKIVSNIFGLLVNGDKVTRNMFAGQFVEMMSVWQGHRNGWEREKGRLLAGEFHQLLSPNCQGGFARLIDTLIQSGPVKANGEYRPRHFERCVGSFLDLADRSREEIGQYRRKHGNEAYTELWGMKVPCAGKQGQVVAKAAQAEPINWQGVSKAYEIKERSSHDGSGVTPVKISSNSQLLEFWFSRNQGFRRRASFPVVTDEMLARIFYLPPQRYNELPRTEQEKYIERAHKILTNLGIYRIGAYGHDVFDRAVYEELIAIAKEHGFVDKAKPSESFKTARPILDPAIAARYFDLTMLDVINRFSDALPTGQLRYQNGAFMLYNWPSLDETKIAPAIDSAARAAKNTKLPRSNSPIEMGSGWFRSQVSDGETSSPAEDLARLLGFSEQEDFQYAASHYRIRPLFDLILLNPDFTRRSLEQKIELARRTLQGVAMEIVSERIILELFTNIWDSDYQQELKLRERLDAVIKYIRCNLVGFHPKGQPLTTLEIAPLMEGVVIDFARQDELDEVMEFREREFVPKVRLERAKLEEERTWVASLLKEQDNGVGFVMVVRLEGEIVGHTLLDRPSNDTVFELSEIAVRGDLQKRGLGINLMKAALDHVLSFYPATRAIRLHDSSEKYRIGKMAERFGFAPVGRGWYRLDIQENYDQARTENNQRIVQIIQVVESSGARLGERTFHGHTAVPSTTSSPAAASSSVAEINPASIIVPRIAFFRALRHMLGNWRFNESIDAPLTSSDHLILAVLPILSIGLLDVIYLFVCFPILGRLVFWFLFAVGIVGVDALVFLGLVLPHLRETRDGWSIIARAEEYRRHPHPQAPLFMNDGTAWRIANFEQKRGWRVVWTRHPCLLAWPQSGLRPPRLILNAGWLDKKRSEKTNWGTDVYLMSIMTDLFIRLSNKRRHRSVWRTMWTAIKYAARKTRRYILRAASHSSSKDKGSSSSVASSVADKASSPVTLEHYSTEEVQARIQEMRAEALKLVECPFTSVGLRKTASDFVQICENLLEAARLLVNEYVERARRYHIELGEVRVYMAGGRVQRSPLKPDSDIDLVWASEKKYPDSERPLREEMDQMVKQVCAQLNLAGHLFHPLMWDEQISQLNQRLSSRQRMLLASNQHTLLAEIARLIHDVNETDKAGKSGWREEVKSTLQILVELATGNPEHTHQIVQGVNTTYLRDMFIENLVEQDRRKPRFDISGPPQNLLPIQEISKFLQTSDLAGQLRMEDPSRMIYKPNRIGIILGLHPENKLLARLDMYASNCLGVSRIDPDLPADIKEALWNERSGYYDESRSGETSRLYYNLNWTAVITHFELGSLLRGHDIGPIWYEQYVEPYLRGCGFAVIAVRGECLDAPEIEAFWRERGFSGRFPTNQLYNTDTVLRYLSVKKLTTTSSPAASLLVGLLSSFKQALSWKTLKETGRRVLKKLIEPVCGQDSLCWAVSTSLILGGLKLIVFSEEMQRTNHLFADFAGKFGSPWYVIFLPFSGPVFVYILVPLGTLVFQGLEIYFNRPLPRDILHLLGVPAYLRREAADEIQNDRSQFITQGLPATIGFMFGWGAWDGSIAMGLVWLFIVVTWTSILYTDDNLGPKEEELLENEPGSANSLEVKVGTHVPGSGSYPIEERMPVKLHFLAEELIRHRLRKLRPGGVWALSRREQNAVERWVGRDRLLELSKEYSAFPLENSRWMFHKEVIASSGLSRIIQLLRFWR
jgi:predicted N-acetyltransferase YhbS